jgi:SAM-dependent methyltransferase
LADSNPTPPIAPGHRHSDAAANWPAWARVLVISVASLYYELMLIRWLPTEVRILAYFSNVTLIGCILGLGIGALTARTSRIRPSAALVFLAALLLCASIYHGLNLTLPLAGEGNFVWNGLSRAAKGTPLQYVALLAFFALNTAVFVPIGQILGREFDTLPAIPAYVINVAGAMVGLCVFALFSLLELSPLWWFGVGLLLLAPFVRLTATAACATVVIVMIAALSVAEPATYWSPYYKITTSVVRLPGAAVGYEIDVNEDSHQQAFDLSGTFDELADLATRRRIYDEPYRYGTNDRVLILGAGTGNDVAAALRAGAKHVDAVEIDPVILRLGRTLHPEHPYADPRVTLWNREGRTFLRRQTQGYDKIVLGYVDSHSLFSAMSSVRLDNFMYTREAFREMRNRLARGGVLAVTFTIHEQWIADRLYALYSETFGTPPLVFQGANSSSAGTVFLGGTPIRQLHPKYLALIRQKASQAGHTWTYDENEGYLHPGNFQTASIVPTDTWPYLYLRNRGVPANYLICVAALFLLSLVAIRTTTDLATIRWPFFFLGAAFLLIETKAMTELAIFLGSTWTVNFFVIAAVLGLIVLGTTLVLIGVAPATRTTFALLAATLLLTWAAPLHQLLRWESVLRDWVAVVILCLPLFFAAIIFARKIALEPRPSVALGSNLLGALAGGVLEYSSMAFGTRPLYLFALGLYAVAWLTFGPSRQSVAVE